LIALPFFLKSPSPFYFNFSQISNLLEVGVQSSKAVCIIGFTNKVGVSIRATGGLRTYLDAIGDLLRPLDGTHVNDLIVRRHQETVLVILLHLTIMSWFGL